MFPLQEHQYDNGHGFIEYRLKNMRTARPEKRHGQKRKLKVKTTERTGETTNEDDVTKHYWTESKKITTLLLTSNPNITLLFISKKQLAISLSTPRGLPSFSP